MGTCKKKKENISYKNNVRKRILVLTCQGQNRQNRYFISKKK